MHDVISSPVRGVRDYPAPPFFGGSTMFKFAFNNMILFFKDFSKHSFILKYIRKFKYKRCKKKLYSFLRNNQECSLYLGLPGSGKTTFLARIVFLCNVVGLKCYCNVPIKGALPYSKDDIGKYDMSGTRDCPAVILLDEAGLIYDNRQFSNGQFTEESLRFLKLCRHYNVHIALASQSLDIDVKWVRMSKTIWFLRKSVFPGFTSLYRVSRKLDVNPDTHKLEDYYDKSNSIFARIFHFRFLRRPYYKLFDSWSAPKLKPFPNLAKYKPYEFTKGVNSL